MESYWKTWEELALLSSHKKIVLYGRSEDWVPKIMRKIKLPVCIIDKNTIYEDTKYKGVDVVGPEDLLKMVRDDIYIIIRRSYNA